MQKKHVKLFLILITTVLSILSANIIYATHSGSVTPPNVQHTKRGFNGANQFKLSVYYAPNPTANSQPIPPTSCSVPTSMFPDAKPGYVAVSTFVGPTIKVQPVTQGAFCDISGLNQACFGPCLIFSSTQTCCNSCGGHWHPATTTYRWGSTADGPPMVTSMTCEAVAWTH